MIDYQVARTISHSTSCAQRSPASMQFIQKYFPTPQYHNVFALVGKCHYAETLDAQDLTGSLLVKFNVQNLV